MKKNTLLLIPFFVAVCGVLFAQQPQTIKLPQLETAKVVEGTRAGQIGLTDTNGKQRYNQYVEIEPTPVGFTPTATGNTSNFSEFVTDPGGDIWYIDWQGLGLLLKPSSSTSTVTTDGPIQGDGSGGDPVTFVDGGSSGDVWQWNGTTWVLASVSGTPQTIAVAANTTTLSDGGGSMTIAGAGINVATTSGTTITVTGTEVDGLTNNEGSLTVGAGTGTTSLINSNTSGSTAITIEAGTGLTISESGNTITLSASPGSITTSGPIQGDGTGGDPVTFVDGGSSGDVWQWNGSAWVLASVSGTPQTIAVAGNTTTLSDGGGSMTIAGAGINVATTSGSTITVTGTEVDGLTNNEGSLTVGAGASNTSLINSNTAGSTPVTIEASTGLTIAESGNTIILSADPATVTTSGPIQGDGSGGDPVTFVDGVTSGDVWQWNGSAWVLASVSGAPQTIAVAGNTTTLSDGGGSMTIAGAGINVATTSGSTITVTGTEVDGLTNNEGSLTVGAGASNTSLINSNTAGSTPVTITAGTGLTIGESGNNITLTPADPSLSNEGSLSVNPGTGSNSIIQSNTAGSANITIQAGANVSVTESGNTITIAADDETTRTINAGAGIGVSGSDPTWTISATDIAPTNEGSLTTSTASGTRANINSNTSGSTAVGIEAGTGLAISQTSNVITLTPVDQSATNEIQELTATGSAGLYDINLTPSAGGTVGIFQGDKVTIDRAGNDLTINASEYRKLQNASNATTHTLELYDSYSTSTHGSLVLQEGANISLTTTGTAPDAVVTIAATSPTETLNGYYGGNGGNGGDNTIPAATTSTLTDQLTLQIQNSDLVVGGTVPFRIQVDSVTFGGTWVNFMSMVSGVSDPDKDSLYFYLQDDNFAINGTRALSIISAERVTLSGSEIKLSGLASDPTEETFLVISPTGIVKTREGSGGGGGASIITPSEITSDQDNYNPTGFATATIVRVSGDNGIRAITSMAAGSDGDEKKFINVGDYPIYFPSQHPDGTAANRLDLPTDYILFPGNTAPIYYDGVSSRWRITTNQGSPTLGSGKVISYQWSNQQANVGMFQLGAANGGTQGTTAPSSTLPSSYDQSTGTATNGRAYGYIPKGTSQFSYYGSAAIKTTALVSIPVLSDGTDTYSAHFQTVRQLGFDVTAADAVGIRYSSATNGGRWEGYTKGAGDSFVDLGISVAANTIYLLDIEIDKAASEARFYVNGVFSGRLTTNLPTSAAFGSRVVIEKSAGTTARTIQLFNLIAEAIYP